MNFFSLLAVCCFSVLFAAEISQSVVNYSQVALWLSGITFNLYVMMKTR